jgi:hypothetical protein
VPTVIYSRDAKIILDDGTVIDLKEAEEYGVFWVHPSGRLGSKSWRVNLRLKLVDVEQP